MQAQPQPAADSIPLGRPLSSGPAPAEGPAPRSWPLPPPQVALTSGCGHSPGPFVAPEASAQARPESPQACRAWSSPRPVLPGRVVSRGRRAAAATGEKAPSPPPAGRAAVAPSSHLPTALGGPPPRRVPRPWAVSRDTHSPPRQASAFQLSCQRRTRSSCGRLGGSPASVGPLSTNGLAGGAFWRRGVGDRQGQEGPHIRAAVPGASHHLPRFHCRSQFPRRGLWESLQTAAWPQGSTGGKGTF